MRSSSHSLGVGAMSRSTSTSLSYSLVVLRDTCAFTLSSVTHRVTHADAVRLVVRRRLPALFLFCFCTWPILSASSARRRARVGALVLPGIKRPPPPLALPPALPNHPPPAHADFRPPAALPASRPSAFAIPHLCIPLRSLPPAWRPSRPPPSPSAPALGLAGLGGNSSSSRARREGSGRGPEPT